MLSRWSRLFMILSVSLGARRLVTAAPQSRRLAARPKTHISSSPVSRFMSSHRKPVIGFVTIGTGATMLRYGRAIVGPKLSRWIHSTKKRVRFPPAAFMSTETPTAAVEAAAPVEKFRKGWWYNFYSRSHGSPLIYNSK